MAVPIVWALLLIGGRFAIRPLAQVAAKNARYVKAHINSTKKPLLTGTPQNPNGVITKAGNLSKAKNIIPVGTPGWSGDFLKAALNPKAANLITQIRLYGTKKAVTQLAVMGISIEALEATIDENAKTEYNVLTGQEVPKGGIGQDIEARAKELFDFEDAKRVPDYITDYRAEVKTDPYRDNKQALRRRVPEYDVPTLRAVPVHTTRKSPEELAKDAETDAARQWIKDQNRSHDDRTAMERAAIRDASPKFTSAELSPYKKVSESGFGQKLFGLRRSKSEIDRDVTYTDLKMQGRDEEADQYWSDWNAENKAKRDAALGEGKSLTEYTRDAPTRGEEDSPAGKTSFAEDIIKKVNKVLPQKKKGGGRVSSRPKSYRNAKVIKQYAKGGSVRKPNRIK